MDDNCPTLECEDEAVSLPTVWQNKYKLDTLDEVVMNEEAVCQVLKLTEESNPPKILLVGQQFSSMAVLTFSKIILAKSPATAFNQLSSTDGITPLIGKLSQFLMAETEFELKNVVVHSFDILTKNEQHQLWGIIQVHSKTGFILLTSNELDVIPEIKNKFNLINFRNDNYLLKKLHDVCAAEKIEFAEKALHGIVEKVDGNFSQALATLQELRGELAK